MQRSGAPAVDCSGAPRVSAVLWADLTAAAPHAAGGAFVEASPGLEHPNAPSTDSLPPSR